MRALAALGAMLVGIAGLAAIPSVGAVAQIQEDSGRGPEDWSCVIQEPITNYFWVGFNCEKNNDNYFRVLCVYSYFIFSDPLCTI